MAIAPGSNSSARKFSGKRCDFWCEQVTQDNFWKFLEYWPFALLALLVGVGSVLLLLRFAVSPQIKAYVVDSRLSSFALTNEQPSGGPATYNISISVALTVRNPNGAMEITYTKPLVAIFLFDDRRLYNLTVADEGHKHKPHKREMHLLHTGGEVPYVLDTAAAQEFNKQNASGVIKVEMRLSGEITLGIGNNRVLELSCPLMLRRPPPQTLGTDPDVVVFHEVDCIPDKPKKIVF